LILLSHQKLQTQSGDESACPDNINRYNRTNEIPQRSPLRIQN